MSGALIYTCPDCRAIVDYTCLCDEPPPIARLVGHATVAEAKAHVIALKDQAACHLCGGERRVYSCCTQVH